MKAIGQHLSNPSVGVLVAMLLPVIALAGFINKPFDVDDPLFVWTAQHIASDPLDFFGFMAHWKWSAQPAHEVMQNPPLLAYTLAPIGMLSGWAEWALRVWMLVWTMAAAAGVYFLAGHFCRHRLLASAVAVVTPGFLVSATHVMSDVPLVAAWVWALYFWMGGIERHDMRRVLAAAVLVAVAGLTKYFGIALIPLLVAHGLASRQFRPWPYIALLLPAAVFTGYEIYTYVMYGHGLILDAGAFVYDFERDTPLGPLGKFITLFVFLGASVPAACLLIAFVRPREGLAVLVATGVILLLVWLAGDRGFFSLRYEWDPFVREAKFFERAKGAPWDAPIWVLLQWSFWLPAGVLAVAMAVKDAVTTRDARTLTLLLWIAGVCCFALFFYHLINVRVLLPVFPALALAAVRAAEEVSEKVAETHREAVLTPFVVSGVLAVLAMLAGYRQAVIQRLAAEDIASRHVSASHTLWFSGHFAFQYYMEQRGAEPADTTQEAAIETGDRFALPSNTGWPLFPEEEAVQLLQVFAYEPFPFFSIMNYHSYAGFYADTVGPLPYVIDRAHPEEYAVFRVVDKPVIKVP